MPGVESALKQMPDYLMLAIKVDRVHGLQLMHPGRTDTSVDGILHVSSTGPPIKNLHQNLPEDLKANCANA
jgi:hypothetical protein